MTDLAESTIKFKAQLILDAIRAVYLEAEVALPERQYFAAGSRGETIHDCEQVTVAFEMTYTGTPGAPTQAPLRCNAPTTSTFIVELVRRVPVSRNGTSPVNADLMSQYASLRMDDAELLADSARRAIGASWSESGLFDVTTGSAQSDYQAMVLSVIIMN